MQIKDVSDILSRIGDFVAANPKEEAAHQIIMNKANNLVDKICKEYFVTGLHKLNPDLEISKDINVLAEDLQESFLV